MREVFRMYEVNIIVIVIFIRYYQVNIIAIIVIIIITTIRLSSSGWAGNLKSLIMTIMMIVSWTKSQYILLQVDFDEEAASKACANSGSPDHMNRFEFMKFGKVN